MVLGGPLLRALVRTGARDYAPIRRTAACNSVLDLSPRRRLSRGLRPSAPLLALRSSSQPPLSLPLMARLWAHVLV